jgi:FtsZ-interacting cell division protein ZipA
MKPESCGESFEAEEMHERKDPAIALYMSVELEMITYNRMLQTVATVSVILHGIVLRKSSCSR